MRRPRHTIRERVWSRVKRQETTKRRGILGPTEGPKMRRRAQILAEGHMTHERERSPAEGQNRDRGNVALRGRVHGCRESVESGEGARKRRVGRKGQGAIEKTWHPTKEHMSPGRARSPCEGTRSDRWNTGHCTGVVHRAWCVMHERGWSPTEGQGVIEGTWHSMEVVHGAWCTMYERAWSPVEARGAAKEIIEGQGATKGTWHITEGCVADEKT